MNRVGSFVTSKEKSLDRSVSYANGKTLDGDPWKRNQSFTNKHESRYKRGVDVRQSMSAYAEKRNAVDTKRFDQSEMPRYPTFESKGKDKQLAQTGWGVTKLVFKS